MHAFRFRRLAVLLTAAVASVIIVLSGPAGAQQTSPVPDDHKAAVRDLLVDNPEVLEVLSRHPEIVAEAMQKLTEKRKAETAATLAAISANRKELLDDGISFVAGNPKGDVTVVEFFDYRCPYCKQMQPHLQALLKEDSRIRLVLKELPVLGPDSVVASRAAMAALAQGKYMAFHDAMMGFRGQLSEAEIFRMAKESGLDIDRLKTDMQSPKVTAAIKANLALADKLGIQGTPGFVIGNELVPGATSLDYLRHLVVAARS